MAIDLLGGEKLDRSFDVVVIGGGHAGCEAVSASCKLGCKTLLISMSWDGVAHMPCNPAIGGLGKGHLVHEIDALGGMMGRIADATGIQFRLLNRSRGAAVRGTRCQSDRKLYGEHMRAYLRTVKGLSFLEAEVEELLFEGHHVQGVKAGGVEIAASAVVITTGTFLNGSIFMGSDQRRGGRIDELSAQSLAQSMGALKLNMQRLKTGTVPRLDAKSINWDILERQWGDEERPKFSFWRVEQALPQVSCSITHTNPKMHALILDNLNKSAMYSGLITGIGPRYCPSIEDKLVRFADKSRHQIFLEPVALDSDEIYPNGLSTGLPVDVQTEFVQAIAGLEEAKIIQPGYAVEYDAIDPTKLDLSFQTKDIKGLFCAGQINGTTGYEEAAAQGLMAGINAAHYVMKRPEFLLKRSEAYIGVLSDDLVSKGVDEPYRMFTSRAEHRILLREDNADLRLSQKAYEIGLLDEDCWHQVQQKQNKINKLHSMLSGWKISPTEDTNRRLTALGEVPLRNTVLAKQLVLRHNVGIKDVVNGFDGPTEVAEFATDQQTLQHVETDLIYESYVHIQLAQLSVISEIDHIRIPSNMVFSDIPGLSNEVSQKLSAKRPHTLGNASKISGITPAALCILANHIQRYKKAN